MLNKKNKTINGLVFAGIVVFALVGLVTEAQANLVDSNSIIKDDIEYYFQTDKSIYNLGETVDMLYRVKNLGDSSVLFRFVNSPVTDRCQFMVDKDADRIWDNRERIVFPLESQFSLTPSEARSFTWTWDMTDLDGSQILPGIYDVTGVLDSLHPEYLDKRVRVSVDIQVIPEPATIALLGAGIIGILSYRKRKQ